MPDGAKKEQRYNLLSDKIHVDEIEVGLGRGQKKKLELEYEIKGPSKEEIIKKTDKWEKKISIEKNELYKDKDIVVKTKIPENKVARLEIISGKRSFDIKENPDLKLKLSGKAFKLIPSAKDFRLLSNKSETEISFKKIDEDSNGLTDSIEWTSKTGEEFSLEEVDLSNPSIYVVNSIGELVNADIKELIQVEGIGNIKAKQIYEISRSRR